MELTVNVDNIEDLSVLVNRGLLDKMDFFKIINDHPDIERIFSHTWTSFDDSWCINSGDVFQNTKTWGRICVREDCYGGIHVGEEAYNGFPKEFKDEIGSLDYEDREPCEFKI